MNPITALREKFDQIDENTDDIEAINERLDEIESRPSPAPDPEPDYDEVDLGDDDERQTGIANQAGIRIEMSETVHGISARISPMTRAVSNAYLRREDGGEILEQVSLDRARPGDWVSFEETISAGETYDILLDADGETFPRGRRTDVDYPIESDALDVTAGIYTSGGATTGNYRYCFDRLQPGDDFSDRERVFGALDDVPRDAEIVFADNEIDMDGDVGAELQSLVDSLDDINHAIVLPETDCRWNTHVRVPASAEFFGLIGQDDGPHCDIVESIDHPLTIGSRRDGVTSAIVRNIDWDISGEDPDGYPLDMGFMQVFAWDWFVIEDCRRLGRRQRWQWRDGDGPFDGYYRLGNAYGLLANVLRSGANGVVEGVRSDGGIHNTREPDNPVAERSGHSGEGIGFSAEISEGTIHWRAIDSRGSVGNTFYIRTGSADGVNIVENCEIYNGCRCSIRLGTDDKARNNYVEFSDMRDRYPGSGLWLQEGPSHCEGLEIHAPDGNHELVRVSSGCNTGTISDLDVYAGPGNDHHTVRLSRSASSATEGVVIEDFHIVDESNGSTPNGANYSIAVNRPDVTFRNGTIDVSNTRRTAFGGRDDPTLENVEIID